MSIQRVRSKWAKTDVLLADADLRRHVPDTARFDRSTVAAFLQKHGMIYVKPVDGTFGSGVIRVEYAGAADSPYRFQSGETKYAFASFDDMYPKLISVKKNKPYLVQQGIHLLKHGGRRFDLRVMVQMNPQSKWETTGMIGRVAHPRKIVTNYHAGGTPMPLEKLFSSHLTKERRIAFGNKLRKLGIDVAVALEKKYPRLKEIGVDVAVDTKFNAWVLEVNTLPDPFLFKKLPNRAVFRRIYAYAVAYGRFRARKRGA
ncbi:YheC/YheD family protein [Cohnella suwonensis]|uniref:YheC/YheD family protein n=1 Tax=Cohnella suwonensis TaxID=696072 RepID=A0ABW0LUA5_9BACL